jgi:hypothetical protein
MKRGKFIVITLILLILPLVTADIFIDQLQTLYNVGDVIETDISISSSLDTTGFLSTFLICGLNQIETFRSLQILTAGEEKQVNVIAILDSNLVNPLGDECYIRALYGAGEARSQVFKASRKVNVEVSVNPVVVDPGTSFNVSGRAIKENREPLSGFVEVVVEGLEITVPAPLEFVPVNEPVEIVEPVEEVIEEEVVVEEETTDEDRETSKDEEESELSNGMVTVEEFNKRLRGELTSEDPSTLPSTTSQSRVVSQEDSNETLDAETEEEIEEPHLEVSQEKDSEIKEVRILEQESISKSIIIGSFSGEIVEGAFNAGFKMPEDAPPGTYTVTAKTFEKDRFGNIVNQGQASTTIRVKQIIKGIELIFNTESIVPENEFQYTAIILDQAGNHGEGEVEITILDPKKSKFKQRLVKASETNPIYVATNFTPGIWEVNAKLGAFEVKKNFLLEELTKLSSRLEAGMLVITNIGNIPYSGPVEISIGDKTEVRKINLEVGESIRFALEAPNGEYEIFVNDGKNKQTLGKTFLTGNAIGIDQVGNFLFGSAGLWIWTLVIVILIIVILIFVRKIFKKKYIGKVPKSISPSGKLTPISKQIEHNDQTTSTMGSLINKGSKQEAAIVALKIKKLTPKSTQVIDSVLTEAKSAGSKIYVDHDYRIIIFSPSTTKSSDNDIRAITIAKDIEKTLINHNNSAHNKIEFGIGVHSGFLAVETTPHTHKIKFVSLDNTISISKRVAEQAKNIILLSEPMHKKTLGKVKVVKHESFWKLTNFMDRSKHQEFVNKFLQRQKKDKI